VAVGFVSRLPGSVVQLETERAAWHLKWVVVSSAWRVIGLWLDGRPTRGDPAAYELGEPLTIPRRKS
jgi:hypothetical protein